MGNSKLETLLKCIVLLYRERESGESDIDNSKALVKTIINLQKDGYSKNIIGGDNQILEDVKKILLGILTNPETIDKTALIDALRLALREKDTTFAAIEKTLNTELSVPGMKRNIISLRNQLDLFFKEQQALMLLTKSTISLRQGLEDVSLYDFLTQLATNIEALSTPTKSKDPGIVDEMDVGDVEEVSKMMVKVKKINEAGGLIVTGFKELNRMFRGGWRLGEFIIYQALQHNYKSGLAQTLSAQIPTKNDPFTFLKDKTKKPLLLFLSLEDDAEIIINFVYLYLFNNENGFKPDISTISKEEMATYVKERLGAKGWHVKYYRINPSEWTYKHMFNLVLKLESMGYEILTCITDYLAKLPTIGCVNSGSTGSDLHDLFNRVRNFFSARGILFISPHQLSTEAKQLTRQNVVSDLNFVKEIAGKGYSELSKRLDQIWDAGFYIHKAYINRKPVLTIGWDKHRRPGSVDDKYKYAILNFPKDRDMPIMETINNPDTESGENGDDLDGFDI